jgi:hypothetical protein
MLRPAVFTLLAASVLAGSLEAQRTGGAFSGNAGRPAVHSGFAGFRLHHHNNFNGFPAAYFFSDYGPFPPDYAPFGYEQHYVEAVSGAAPPVVIEQRADGQLRTPAPAKQQIIEIPNPGNSKAGKTLPPTIFILADGERLETRRFMLTLSDLSVTIDRRDRTIRLDMIDIDASIAANRERGIDLRVPANRNEIFLSF